MLVEYPRTETFCDRRVGENSLYFSGDEYSNYLCFKVSIRFNHLNPEYNSTRYTPHQQNIHTLIKSLHDSGLGYRKISHHLNEKGVLTEGGKRWGGNSVFSVLKRYEERVKRLEFRNKRYGPVRSKMWIEFDTKM